MRSGHTHYTLDCLYEVLALYPQKDGKRHVIEIDSARTLKTPQDVEAILAGFETVRNIVEVEVEKYTQLAYQ